jgi:uncharacterized membrane protein YidH (DUF202 family)
MAADLANERTHMAWTRTALSSIVLGAVIMRAFSTNSNFLVTGLLLVVQGMVFLIYAAYRYYRIMSFIQRYEFDPAKGSILLLTATTVGLSCTAAVLLFVQ